MVGEYYLNRGEGNKKYFSLPADWRVRHFLLPAREKGTGTTLPDLLKGALAAPVNSPGLSDLASEGFSAVILVDDHTRPTPIAGMIGYPEFKKMKPTSYFINTARGEIVEEKALIKALNEGLIAGAGLDVLSNEPLQNDNPLFEMQNVILTGHSAWYSTASDAEFWQKAMTQVAMALRGEWPIYAVNPEVKDRWVERWGR